MYRRNLDIAIAAIIAILGGLAAAAHLPGIATIPLGVGLFFAPGYLWSAAILNQRLSGIERALTSVGMALILPILGGFLFFGLKIPLFKSSWIGLLVVLALLGVVAVAAQRLREELPERRQQAHKEPPRRSQQPVWGGLSVLHASIFGLAAVIGIGSVVFSVKNAEAQKFPGSTILGMSVILNSAVTAQQNNIAALSGIIPAPTNGITPAQIALPGAVNGAQAQATEAHLSVTNDQGVPEQYRVQLLKKGKVVNTWNITLADTQKWQITIAYTLNSSIVANLYLMPDVKTVYRTVSNGY
jgi:hypothetical protein